MGKPNPQQRRFLLGRIELSHRPVKLEPAFEERHGEIELDHHPHHGERRRVRIWPQCHHHHSRWHQSSHRPRIASCLSCVFPSSIKQPNEFFGGWGGLNPYGSSMVGLHLEHCSLQEPRRSLHGPGQPDEGTRQSPAKSGCILQHKREGGGQRQRSGSPQPTYHRSLRHDAGGIRSLDLATPLASIPTTHLPMC